MKTNLDMVTSRRKELLELIAAASDEIAAIDAAVVKEGEIDHSKAAYVDSQYERLQTHNSEGMAPEDLRRMRAGRH
jgi:hypothetical protein